MLEAEEGRRSDNRNLLLHTNKVKITYKQQHTLRTFKFIDSAGASRTIRSLYNRNLQGPRSFHTTIHLPDYFIHTSPELPMLTAKSSPMSGSLVYGGTIPHLILT